MAHSTWLWLTWPRTVPNTKIWNRNLNKSPPPPVLCWCVYNYRMAEDDERKPLLSRDALSTQTICTATNEAATLVGGTSMIGPSFSALWSKMNKQTRTWRLSFNATFTLLLSPVLQSPLYRRRGAGERRDVIKTNTAYSTTRNCTLFKSALAYLSIPPISSKAQKSSPPTGEGRWRGRGTQEKFLPLLVWNVVLGS